MSSQALVNGTVHKIGGDGGGTGGAVVGSYVGRGESSKTITFPFEPALVLIICSVNTSTDSAPMYIAINGCTTIVDYSATAAQVTWGEKSMTVKNTKYVSVTTSGRTFYYCAIPKA